MYDATIAILTKNGGTLLARALDAIFAQETSRRFEVLVIDSGSTDGTLDVLRKHPVRVMTIPPEAFDFGKTRDLAYQNAQSPFVVNLSQDAIPMHEAWLENLLRPFDDLEVSASCGPSLPDPDRHFPQFPWELNGYFYFTREIRKFVARYGKGLSFANSAVRRDVWERLRFDKQPLGEDFQFQIKLYNEGLAIAFPHDAPVLHHHNYDTASLYRRCRNEGLSLRVLGCPYTERDLLADLASPGKYIQWLREVKRGSLTSPAAALFPVLRPLAVYAGSRFARRPVWH